MAHTSVILKALTPEAKAALGGDRLEITRFPFKVGRESREYDLTSDAVSRRRTDSLRNNDLYLQEPGTVLNVSREHFLIDERDATYVLVDRGSTCGTMVEGKLLGGRRTGGWKQLQNNDVIIVGTSESRFVFKFVVTTVP